MYADDGFMSALMVATDRAPVDAPSLMATDDGHALAAARSCIAYSGRFEVIGDQVHHHVSQSLLPDWKGQTLVRTISWDGDLLVLSTPVEATPSGKRLVNKLSWSRPTDLM